MTEDRKLALGSLGVDLMAARVSRRVHVATFAAAVPLALAARFTLVVAAALVAAFAPPSTLAAPGNPVLQLGPTGLQWSSVPGCTGYDVLRGDLGGLQQTRGNFTVATTQCAANNMTGTALGDAESPAAGEGFWYLGRAVPCREVGTWDSGGPSQQGSRDAEIAASPIA